MPDGYRLTTMAEYGDTASRSAAHRAAFSPSRFTDEVYAVVRETWPYRADLDCVAVAPDGSVASYTLAWLDEENRVGEFEPVGTHEAHRRRGLGRAVNLFALQRLRDEGATEALVGCRGDDAYPIPRKLYESVGFREIARAASYGRPARQPCPGDRPRDRAVEDVWNVGRTSVGQTRVRLVSDAEGGRRQQSSPRVPVRLRPALPAAGGVFDRFRDRARRRCLPRLSERVDRDRRRPALASSASCRSAG